MHSWHSLITRNFGNSISDIIGICPIPHVGMSNIYTHGDHCGDSKMYVGFFGFLLGIFKNISKKFWLMQK